MKDAKARVLIVEDELLTAWATEAELREFGYEVFGIAEDLDTALEAAHADRFDVVVLDLELNGRLSYPVAEELERHHIPFVVASATPVNDNAPAPLQRVPHLLKPYDPHRLQKAIEMVLAG